MKIYFYTFGCKVNQYDTQTLRENLAAGGHKETSSPETADAIVINSCTVTSEADRQCRQIVRRMLKASSPSAKVVICGCYSKRAQEEVSAAFASEPRVVVAADPVHALLPASSAQKRKDSKAPFFSASPLKSFSEKSRAYVKIQDGCDQFCSYCAVPLARAAVVSRAPDGVSAEVDSLVSNGYPEIVLCGVRLGRYNPSRGYFLENLAEELLSLRGDFRLRFSSLEQGEITGGLARLMIKEPTRICPHLHVPLQSGSDAVLKKMNRPYTAAGYASKISGIKKEFETAGVALALTTDVIIGFPGETDADFEATLSLCRGLGFAKLHIFPYSARPGTAAASMDFRRDAVYLKTLARRKKELFALSASLEKSARSASMSRPHKAVAVGDGWILTEDYQYYKMKEPTPAGIFDFDPRTD